MNAMTQEQEEFFDLGFVEGYDKALNDIKFKISSELREFLDGFKKEINNV